MLAEWSAECSAEDPVLVVPWKDPDGNAAFVDLRTNPPKDLSNHTVAATTSTKLTSRPNLSQSLYARGENVSPSTTIMLGDMTGDGTAAYPHVSGPWTMTSTVTAAVPAGATALSFHWPVQYGTFQPVTPELISPKMMISAHPGKVVVVFFDGHDDSIANDSTYPQ